MKHLAYIALGSNLENPKENLDRAIGTLSAFPQCQVHSISNFFKAKPVGGPTGQQDYLNACVGVLTSFSPFQLMSKLLEIEESMGRVRGVANGPRTLDLDLLLFDDNVLAENGLVIPHPRLEVRAFVLRPLFEIAPYVLHPVLNKTVGDLLLSLEGVLPTNFSNSMNLGGKRFLVTGSTSGIGREVALELAKHGAIVIFHGRGKEGTPETLIRLASHRGGAAYFIPANLASENERKDLAIKSWELLGGLDGVVLNAGADILTGDLARQTTWDKFKELLLVDLESTFYLARELGNRMKSLPNGGSLVTMGWDHSSIGFPGDSGQVFSAVKGAIAAFSKSLAISLAPEVRVNCVEPGWIKTKWGGSASTYWQEKAIEDCPLRRWGSPLDVAFLVRMLLSNEASFIHGQSIKVNGGVVRS